MSKLLLVKSEHATYAKMDACIVIVPDAYNPDTALNETILPFPDAYVVGEFQIVADDTLDQKVLEKHEYESFSPND